MISIEQAEYCWFAFKPFLIIDWSIFRWDAKENQLMSNTKFNINYLHKCFGAERNPFIK